MKQALFKIVKSFLGQAEYSLRSWNYASDELLVLCMHSTPRERASQFSDLLDFLLANFCVLNPDQLDDYFTGKLNAGPYILFTFDDGLKNNMLAADMLEARKARGIFFIVPDFIEASNPQEYYRRHIRQIIDTKVDHEPEDFTPMNLSELNELKTRGHFIESHTMSHLLRSNSDDDEIEREVIQSKRWIEKNFGNAARVFCSPIQTNFSVNAKAKRFIHAEYDYHFTTFPGLHTGNRNPQLVFRRNIEVHWTLGQIKYALGKADLSRWKDEIARFQRL